MIISTYQCDLCLTPITQGTTIVYSSDPKVKIKIISTWDHLAFVAQKNKEIIKHICPICRAEINAVHKDK